MTSDNQTPMNAQEQTNYESLFEPETILVGKTGFIEVAYKRAHLPDGTTRDFVMVTRGYVTKSGTKRAERLVTIPAHVAGRVASAISAPALEPVEA